jgi:DNA adenine methylase
MAGTAFKGVSSGRVFSTRGANAQAQLHFTDLVDYERLAHLRPPLKWAGGKRWLVPYLERFWRPSKDVRLVEPFVGGLSVALGLRPKHALLNDVNPHPVNLYRWIQKGLVIDQPLLNSASAFEVNRRRFNSLVKTARGRNSKVAATLFYYLNRTCFNGLCRFNRAGEFNVPFGRYKTIEYRTDFREYGPIMREWEFTVEDFEALHLDPTDFVYADPPYDSDNTQGGGFTSYSKTPFGWEEQVRLASWLARHHGPVVLSNHATGRILDLYREAGFKMTIINDAPRMISCNGDRTPAREVLATLNL